LSNLNDKVRGGLDLSIDLAESGQTMRMTKILKEAQRLGRGSIPGLLASGWLQFQYGWKPLISDLFGCADESIRVVTNHLQRIQGKAQMAYRTPSNYSPSVIRAVTGKQACTIGIELNVPDFDLSRWSSLNPVSIAYELVPFSFVVDWVYDIGSTLRNFETAVCNETNFVAGYVSELRYITETRRVDLSKAVVQGENITRTEHHYMSYRTEIDFQRSILHSYPLPLQPQISLEMGWQRVTSAAALLSQMFEIAMSKRR